MRSGDSGGDKVVRKSIIVNGGFTGGWKSKTGQAGRDLLLRYTIYPNTRGRTNLWKWRTSL